MIIAPTRKAKKSSRRRAPPTRPLPTSNGRRRDLTSLLANAGYALADLVTPPASRSIVPYQGAAPNLRVRNAPRPPPAVTLTNTQRIRDNHIVPFDVTSAAVYSSTSTATVTAFGGPASGYIAFALDPNTPIGGLANNYPFGLPIANLATSYRRWRLLSLRMEVIPMTPPSASQTATVAFCTVPDGAVDNNSPSLITVLSVPGSTVVPSGVRWKLPPQEFVKDWLYTADATTQTTSTTRQTDAGTMFAYMVNPATTTGVLLFMIRMTGSIEFMDLTPAFHLASVTDPAEASSSSPPVLRSLLPPTTFQPHGLTSEPALVEDKGKWVLIKE